MEYELLLQGLVKTLKGQPVARRKGGSELIFLCPSCHSNKLHVNAKKNKWYCFREAIGGEIPIEVHLNTRADMDISDPDDAPTLADLEVPEDTIPIDAIASELTKALIYEYLEGRNISRQQIQKYAFYSPAQPGRVILKSPQGYWAARRIPHLLDFGSPYINPPGQKLCWTTSRSTRYVICEGPFDAMAYERAGLAACALLGSDVSPTQLEFISTLEAAALILDSKTSVKAWKIYNRIKLMGPEVMMYFFDLLVPGVKDPGDAPTEVLRRRCEASRITDLIRPSRT